MDALRTPKLVKLPSVPFINLLLAGQGEISGALAAIQEELYPMASHAGMSIAIYVEVIWEVLLPVRMSTYEPLRDCQSKAAVACVPA